MRARTWHRGHIRDIEAHTWHWGHIRDIEHIRDTEGTYVTLRAPTWHWGHILDIEGTYSTLRAHTWHWGHIRDIEAHTWHWGTYSTLRAHTWHWGHIRDIECTYLVLTTGLWEDWRTKTPSSWWKCLLMRLKSLFCLTALPPISTVKNSGDFDSNSSICIKSGDSLKRKWCW